MEVVVVVVKALFVVVVEEEEVVDDASHDEAACCCRRDSSSSRETDTIFILVDCSPARLVIRSASLAAKNKAVGWEGLLLLLLLLLVVEAEAVVVDAASFIDCGEEEEDRFARQADWAASEEREEK